MLTPNPLPHANTSHAHEHRRTRAHTAQNKSEISESVTGRHQQWGTVGGINIQTLGTEKTLFDFFKEM